MNFLTDAGYLRTLQPFFPATPPVEKISEWIEGRRILPNSTPFPGSWRNERTPYGVEIMDACSPYSPVQFVVVMKPRKVGMSTLFENCVGYYIEQLPSPQLYTTANAILAKDWSDKKLPPLIDSLNIRHLITASTSNAKSRQSGDTTERKDYKGGSLDIMSSQSKQAQRALDVRCLWIDEVDGLDPLTSSNEGVWTEILFEHTASWAERKKIALFSSPATIEKSLIWRYYEKGDQRKFLIPCPYCGEYIELEMGQEKKAYGLNPVTKGGKIIDAVYVCPSCGEAIENGHKEIFYSPAPYTLKNPKKKLPPAYWKPTRDNGDPTYRSYSLNALYSPVGMVSFKDVCLKKAAAEEGTPDDMRSFINIYAGLPYKDAGTRPRLSAVINHRGTYARGTVPEECIFLTAAVDVQEGSKRNLDKPPRVEIMILGTGLGYKNWVIDYRAFDGSIDDPYSGAWEKMYEWLKSIDGTFYSADGIAFRVELIFIDSGDASYTSDGTSRSDIVYRYCERHSPLALPIKGFAKLKPRPGEGKDIDIPGSASFRRYRLARIGTGGEYVVEISTAHYKGTLFSRLNTRATEQNPSPNGYLAVFREANDEFFTQITNSEQRADGSFRDLGDHEVMDTAIYALCAADLYLARQVDYFKNTRLEAGLDRHFVELSTNSKFVLQYLQERINAFRAAKK
jgi:phage terminase large subunit GpA-like protein